MAELADHAWSHALAVLGDPAQASEAARTAVRRGGRSRSGVLAHARHEALAVAGDPLSPSADEAAPDDLVELARRLAATRPAVERAIVDLDTRHGLDRAGLGRALGLNPADAGTRASEVFLAWERDLDPALLARLGPLRCEGLAELLESAELWQRPPAPTAEDSDVVAAAPVAVAVHPATVARLLDTAPAVTAHAEGCAVCRDRMKSMVSVRSLLGQVPLDRAPTEVRGAAWGSRLRRPVPPPAVEPGGRSGPPLWAKAVTAVAVLVAIVAGGLAVADERRGRAPETERVDRLTQLPAGGTALAVQPASIEGSTLRPVRLSNSSDRTVRWRVESSDPWLQAEPAGGDLAPGSRTMIAVTLTQEAPEGDVRGLLTILGDEGSSTVVQVLTEVENPPDIAASAQACQVTATVEDEVGVASVELQWTEPNGRPERTPIMQSPDGTGHVGYLPPRPVPLTWLITATDTRGNTATTQPQVLEPGLCVTP